jgi:LPXTG-motif cell wall-anchored protein
VRKTSGVVLVALAGLVFLAAPAAALKDPFDPVVEPAAEEGTAVGTTTTVEEPTPTTDENPFSEGMPNTGGATSTWLVVAYLLVVAGAAFLVLVWSRSAAPVRRQDFRS